MPFLSLVADGLDALIDMSWNSHEVLKTGFREPLSQVMKEFEDYSNEAFSKKSAPSLGDWPALSTATMFRRILRLGWYRQAGTGGTIGVWTGRMKGSLTSTRGPGSIRKISKSRMTWGSSFQRAVYFHHGTKKGRKRFGYGGQPARPIIPIPPGHFGPVLIIGSPAEQIALAVFNEWLGSRVPIFRRSSGAIITGR